MKDSGKEGGKEKRDRRERTEEEAKTKIQKPERRR